MNGGATATWATVALVVAAMAAVVVLIVTGNADSAQTVLGISAPTVAVLALGIRAEKQHTATIGKVDEVHALVDGAASKLADRNDEIIADRDQAIAELKAIITDHRANGR